MRNLQTKAPRLRARLAARYAAPALDKGLDILELFASESDGLIASEIARRLGRTVGEIFRMLVCLEHRGYICQVPPGERYFLTLKLFEVAHRYHPLHRLLSDARPLMRQVAHRTGQSCHLAMLSNGEVVVVAQVDAPGNMGFSVRLGARIDLLNTASGHVILAFQESGTRARHVAAWQHRSNKKAPRDFEHHLNQIRRRGYEELSSYQVSGVVNISFPVLNQHGEAIAAIAVPFLARVGDRTGPREVRAALQVASCSLSAAIGGKALLS